jgi:hypothetical protein
MSVHSQISLELARVHRGDLLRSARRRSAIVEALRRDIQRRPRRVRP